MEWGQQVGVDDRLIEELEYGGTAGTPPERNLVDGWSVGIEVIGCIDVGSAVDGQADLAAVEIPPLFGAGLAGLVENGDFHGGVAGKRRGIVVERMAEVDQAHEIPEVVFASLDR